MAIELPTFIGVTVLFCIGFAVGYLVPFLGVVICNVDIRIWTSNFFYAALGGVAGWQLGITGAIAASLGIHIGAFIHMRGDGFGVQISSSYGRYAALIAVLTGVLISQITK